MSSLPPADGFPDCLLCGSEEQRRLFEKGGRGFWQCVGCGLIRVHPLPSAEELERYYRGAYSEGRYTAFAAADEVRHLIARHRLERIRPHARPGRWLDVGCSTGAFVDVAIGAGIAAEGIEVSADAAGEARARGLPVECVGIEHFEPREPYATITAFDVIEHLVDPAVLLARAAAWLEPGGTLVLTLPNVRSVYAALMGRHWFYYAPDDHFFYFEPRTIAALLAAYGLTMRRTRRAFKPLPLAYALEQLASFNPCLGAVARVVCAPVPRAWRERPLPVYVGEMLVIAQRGSACPAVRFGATRAGA